MDLRTPRDAGRLARGTRSFYRLRQSDLARAIGVSRQWLGDLELGKPTLELGLVLRAFEELGLEISVRRSDEPPRWIAPLTLAAEMRESKTLYGDRRRAKQRRERNASIRSGNLTPDLVIDKNWQAKEDEKYYRLVKELPG